MKVYSISLQVVNPQHKVGVQQQGCPPSQYSHPPLIHTCENTYNEVSMVACAYTNAQAINFGYKSILKDLFRAGEMPSVTKGIYGNPIDNKSVSLEHLKPHSKGGRSCLSNFALANIDANVMRGNLPLPMFLNNEMLEAYLGQFNFNIKGIFNGYGYQDMIRRTCRELGVGEKKIEIPDLDVPDFTKIGSSLRTDYGNFKDVVKNIEMVDMSMLPKKMLKSLKNRGYVK